MAVTRYVLELLVFLIVTSVIGFFVLYSITGFIGESIATNARLQANELAGVINILQSSPYKTTYAYSLPPVEGFLKIDGTKLNFTITSPAKRSYAMNFIGNIPVKISDDRTINFNKKKREIYITRCKNEIIISRGEAEC